MQLERLQSTPSIPPSSLPDSASQPSKLEQEATPPSPSDPRLNQLERRKLSSEVLSHIHPDLAKILGADSPTPSSPTFPTESAQNADAHAAVKQEMVQTFKDEFGAKAQNPTEFHKFMKLVYGENYDAAKAEELRQKALQGDYSWLPAIRFVGEETLQGANGAFDKQNGVVYINEKLLSDPKLAAQTFVEEAGHSIDTLVNKNDAAGDEGELFRRVLSGENLSQSQIQAIQSENDHGTITVDGKTVDVEFWNPFKAIGDAVKSVGNAIVNGVKSIGEGIVNGVKSVGEGIGKAFSTVWDGVKTGVGGFFGNLFQGKIGDAFSSVVRGADKIFIQAPRQILQGALNGTENLVNGIVDATGPLAPYLRPITSRIMDAGNTFVTGVFDTVTGFVRNEVEAAGTLLGGFGKILTGKFAEGGKDIGAGFLKFVQSPIDAVFFGGVKALGGIQTLVGLEPAGERLNDREIALLRQVYGDSIDYSQVRVKRGFAGLASLNDRPVTVGNTIYLKNDNTDNTLVHEMAHVWQHQNGGNDYMTESLIDQYILKKPEDGYGWESSVPETPWEQLGPEQQAHLIDEAYSAGFFDPSSPNYRKMMNGCVNISDYMLGVERKIREGFGAP